MALNVEAQPIDLEDKGIWPRPIVDDLVESLDDLRAYESERERIDDLCIESIRARLSPSIDRFAAGRDGLIERIEGDIATRSILGFYCTRLT
jgi:hypothetical protein